MVSVSQSKMGLAFLARSHAGTGRDRRSGANKARVWLMVDG